MTHHEMGRLIWEVNGEPMGFRMLPEQGHGPEMEISERQQGMFLGQEVTNLVTYVATMSPDGTMKGRGQGIAYLKDGSMASWVGQGDGKSTGPGGPQQWTVAIELKSATGKFAEFKGKPLRGEYAVDASWKSHGKLFA